MTILKGQLIKLTHINSRCILILGGDFVAQVRSNLKQLADDKSVSIRQVARDIDYQFETVRKMYNDEMKHFPRDLLNKLCDYFNCNIKDLLLSEDITDLRNVGVDGE